MTIYPLTFFTGSSNTGFVIDYNGYYWLDDSTWIVEEADTITNTGVAFDFNSKRDLYVDIAGRVSSSQDIGVLIQDSDNTLEIRETGVVIGQTYGISVLGSGNTIVNDGFIRSRTSDAVFIDGYDNTLMNYGTIKGATSGIRVMEYDTDIVNRGVITGEVGIQISSDSVFVSNSGMIKGVTRGILYDASYGDSSLNNTGTIMATDSDIAIEGNSGGNVIANRGRIVGDVVLNDGDDIFDSRGGIITGIAYGGGGEDLMYGNDGNNRLEGGVDGDELHGGGGVDRLFGQDGRDVMFGDGGADVLSGGNDNDELTGGLGNDRLIGGLGDDDMWGQGGADILIGGAGVDELYGGLGNDTLRGGGQLDFIDGGLGDDTLTGDGGGDLFIFGRSSGSDVITDFQDGMDIIDLRALGLTDIADVLAAISSPTAGTSVLNLTALGGNGEVSMNVASTVFDETDFYI